MLRSLAPVTSIEGAMISLENGRKLHNLSSNDYLGLGADSLFQEAIKEQVQSYMLTGSTSSRLMAGNYPIFEELEAELARAFRQESALTFVSGYHMNLGIIGALANSQTLILADKLIHASMLDGLRLHNCKFERFRHNDLAHLERLIQKYYTGYSEIVVMVESIYSMDGDKANLQALVKLKKKYPKLMLYVDEAHAIGVRGATGLGLAEEEGLIKDIDFLLGTFGKALASQGGYLICKQVVKDYLINHCRSLIFSTAMPPIRAYYNLIVFKQMRAMTKEREHLNSMSERIRKELKQLGWETTSQSHILPIIIGSAEDTMLYVQALKEMGLYTLAVRPPTVAQGKCRIRLSLTFTSPEDLIISSIRQIKKLSPHKNISNLNTLNKAIKH